MHASLSRLLTLALFTSFFAATSVDAGKDDKNLKRKAAVTAEATIQPGQAQLAHSDDKSKHLPPKKKAIKKFQETSELISDGAQQTTNASTNSDKSQEKVLTDFVKDLEDELCNSSASITPTGNGMHPRQPAEPALRRSTLLEEVLADQVANPPRDMTNASTSLRDPANQPQNSRRVVDITGDDDDNSAAPVFPKFSSATGGETESVRIKAKRRMQEKRKAQQTAEKEAPSKKAKTTQSSATATTVNRPAVNNNDDDNDDVLDLTTQPARPKLAKPAAPIVSNAVDSDDEYRNLTLVELNDKIHDTNDLINVAEKDHQKIPLRKTLNRLIYQKTKLLLAEANPQHYSIWETAKKISTVQLREKAYLLICDSLLKKPSKTIANCHIFVEQLSALLTKYKNAQAAIRAKEVIGQLSPEDTNEKTANEKMMIKIKLLLGIFDFEKCIDHSVYHGVIRNDDLRNEVFFTEISQNPVASDTEKAVANFYLGRIMWAKGQPATDAEARKLLKQAAMSEYLTNEQKKEAKRLFGFMTFQKKGLSHIAAEDADDGELAKNWLNDICNDPATSPIDSGIIQLTTMHDEIGTTTFIRLGEILDNQHLPIEIRLLAAKRIVAGYAVAFRQEIPQNFSPLPAIDLINNTSEAGINPEDMKKIRSEVKKYNYSKNLTDLFVKHSQLIFWLRNQTTQKPAADLARFYKDICDSYAKMGQVHKRLDGILTHHKAALLIANIGIQVNKTAEIKTSLNKALDFFVKLRQIENLPVFSIKINEIRFDLIEQAKDLQQKQDVINYVRAILSDNAHRDEPKIKKLRAKAIYELNYVYGSGFNKPAQHDVARTWKALAENPDLPINLRNNARLLLTHLCLDGRSNLFTMNEQKQALIDANNANPSAAIKAEIYIATAQIMIRENTPASLTKALDLLIEAENEPLLQNQPRCIVEAYELILEHYIDDEKVTRAKIKSIYDYFQRNRVIVSANLWVLANFYMAHLYYCPEVLKDDEKKEKVKHYREVLKCQNVPVRFTKMTADALWEMGEQ